MAISYKFIQKIIHNIAPILPQQRFERIGQFSTTDFFFTLSKTREHAFFISLNQSEPFVGLIDKSFLRHQTISPFYQALKKALDHAFIHSIDMLENNRVVRLRLSTTSPTFVTEEKALYIELIPQHPNLVLVDAKERILLVFHQKAELNAKRPLIRQVMYLPPEPQIHFPLLSQQETLLLEAKPGNLFLLDTPTLFLVDGKPSVLPSSEEATQTITINHWVERYIRSTEMVRVKQLHAPLFFIIKKRLKTLEKKLTALEQDRRQATEHLGDIDKGNALLTYQDSLVVAPSVSLDGLEIALDENLSIVENANRFFRRYRKAKLALNHIDEQTLLAQEETSYLNSLHISLQNANSDEAKAIERELIENGYISQKTPFKKPIEVSAKMPYFIHTQNTKIGFGHNHFQNDYLTFTLAKPNHYFLHTLHYPGSHVVIMDEHPSQAILLLASSIALKLSKLTTGEVMVAKKKMLKNLADQAKLKSITTKLFAS